MDKILTLVLAVYLLARLISYAELTRLCRQLEAIVKEAESYYSRYGYTVGELQAAGVNARIDELEEKGKLLYMGSLKYAALLNGGFLLSWLFQTRIRKAAAGALNAPFPNTGMSGVIDIYQDIRRGRTKNTNYYPTRYLGQMLAALKTSKLSFFGVRFDLRP